MKLKDGIVIDESDGNYIAVATGEAGRAFGGMLRGNACASFILTQLLSETTEEQLVKAVLGKYDVAEETASRDVHAVVEKIRETGLLNE